jgi:hypothetical protein
MSHASHKALGLPVGRRANLHAVKTATPQDLMASLLGEEGVGTVADIARATGVNYQRLLRWSNGTSSAVPQDEMADLVAALGRDPEAYGVQPSLAWRQKRDQHQAPPPWFVDFQIAHMAKLDELNDKLDALLAR